MKITHLSLATLSLVLASSPLRAADLIDTFTVSAEVTDACTALSASDLNFGSAAATNATDDQTFTISVTCTSGAGYTVELDYGATPASAGSTQRQVTNATTGEFMDYTIFQPNATGGAATAVEWGTEATQAGSAYANTGTGGVQALTATGRLDRTEGRSSGIYDDIVVVTLTF